MREKELQKIHDYLVNGYLKKEMVKLIDEYGLYDFWRDYKFFLENEYEKSYFNQHYYFTDATISYFQIKNKK